MMLGLVLLASLQQAAPAASREHSYRFLVAAQGLDQVVLVRFGPGGATVERRTPIRLPSIDSPGPRAVGVAPDGRDYYVTTAHGFPSGELLKFRLGVDTGAFAQAADTIRGREPLGAFPDAVEVTPDGAYAWVTNSPPDGQWQPSWVSVVYLRPMVEVARVGTCTGPRGGQLSADGTRHYSVCMPEDELVEIDVKGTRVARRLAIPAGGSPRCGPSALTLPADELHLYLACQAANEVVEVDARTWSVTRRFAVGKAPAGIAVTRDGRILVVTNRQSQDVSLVDVASGHETARLHLRRHVPADVAMLRPDARLVLADAALLIATAHRSPTGVVISPDGRYAFVSVAGSGDDAGTIEIIDLAARATVASVDVGSGARGIAFWKIEGGRKPK